MRKIAGVLVVCLAAGLARGASGADRDALRAEAVAEADRLAAFTQQMVEICYASSASRSTRLCAHAC